MSGVDVLEELREECRDLWGSVSPFRLGSLVGERRLEVPNPYPNPRGSNLFDDGVTWGLTLPARITGGEA